MAFVSFSVADLQRYLRMRGISSTNHRKVHLVKLAKAAKDLDLKCIDEDDYSSLSISRRTITSKTGESLVLPDICSIEKWDTDLRQLPDIETGDVMVYLINSCGWTSSRLKDYKKDNGYGLFQNDHIQNVLVNNSSSYCYVRATCIPETRQTEKPYDTWVLLENNGSLRSGGCTCVADDGSCKHCVALLFALQSFCERHKDKNTEVGTDAPCTWDKPRKKSLPTKISEMDYGKGNRRRDSFAPNVVINPQRNLEKEVHGLCKGLNSLMLQYIEPPSDDECDTEHLPTFAEMLEEYVGLDGREPFSEFLCRKHDTKYIKEVEEITRGQANSKTWFDHRKGRITASVAHSVTHCRMDRLSKNNYITRRIWNVNTALKLEATQYGKSMEKVALSLYLDEMKTNHSKVNFQECGLFICKDAPYIAATPDGKVQCSCCGTRLVEIKCSFAHQHKTPVEVANTGTYFLYNHEGNVKLKPNNSWYTQIQTQLGVCEMQFCDFVFFTRKGIIIDRIEADGEEFIKVKQHSYDFLTKFLLN